MEKRPSVFLCLQAHVPPRLALLYLFIADCGVKGLEDRASGVCWSMFLSCLFQLIALRPWVDLTCFSMFPHLQIGKIITHCKVVKTK